MSGLFYIRHELCKHRLAKYVDSVVLMSSLQQRVNQILSDAVPDYASDDSEADVINSIYDMLQKAEADLSAARTRVDNLKWKLAKAQEYKT